ncbi:MAG: SHOCT domain-containing protein [Syntrophales bacterium]|jgi:putative membrane protein|nr:SHOCT domain-containing protein [Syntrophales bacterium]
MKKYLAAFIMMTGVLLLASAGEAYYGPRGLGCWGGPMNFGYGGMFMGMILLIVLIAAAIWWFIRGAGNRNYGQPQRETPLDILKKRYAKGEITQDEFEKTRKDL